MSIKFKGFLSAVLTILLCITAVPVNGAPPAEAAEETESIGEGEYEVIYNNDRIIVSLGDSYSSGEGIEPFYGQEHIFDKVMTYDELNDNLKNEDWLCHRSTNAWSGMLKLTDYASGKEITMKDSKGGYNHAGNWYFAAMSGAVTGNILDTEPIPDTIKKNDEKYKHRIKHYYKNAENAPGISEDFSGYVEIEPQLNVFDELNGKKAEYVTITMGGNDIGFTDIVTKYVLNSGFLEYYYENYILTRNFLLDIINDLNQEIASEKFNKTFEFITIKPGIYQFKKNNTPLENIISTKQNLDDVVNIFSLIINIFDRNSPTK